MSMPIPLKRTAANRIRWAGFFFPFSWYMILFLAALWLGWQWLLPQQQQPGTSFQDIFVLLIRVAAWIIGLLLVLGLFSVLPPWIILMGARRRKQAVCRMELKPGRSAENNYQLVRFELFPAVMPLLGFVKLRIVYDGGSVTDKFQLTTTEGGPFSTVLSGAWYWNLEEVREYPVNGVVIYFEDFFQFFSFAVSLPAPGNFFASPFEVPVERADVPPKKNEENLTRINQLKKMQGEYLQYKNFEDRDDVRRIVWKIYARNKELVVRTPEILDPYASHVYVYASFFSVYPTGNRTVQVPFLNYFKSVVWSTYKKLAGQGYEVRYVPDQHLPELQASTSGELVEKQISAATWQKDLDLSSYVRPDEVSVVLVSSLSDAEQVGELIDKHGSNILFMFVPLSESTRAAHPGHWLRRIFVQPDENEPSTAWDFSPLRRKIMSNESELRKTLASQTGTKQLV